MAKVKEKKLAKNFSIPTKVSFDTERQLFNPKIFDNINTGEKTKSDFQFLSMELFKDLNLPSIRNDFEFLADLSPDTLEDKESILNQLLTIRTRLELYNYKLADKKISDYQLYEKKSADLVTLQLMDTVDEESINKTQAEIRELVQEGKNNNAETVALMELLRVVNEKIEKTKLAINNDYKMLIASRLRQARENVGLTQQQLADSVGILPGRLTLYENGHREPDLYTLQKITKNLNISLDDLAKV